MHAHTPHIYARTPHTQLAHTLARMYHYSHCGRKGHLTNFCYDKLNILNKHVWVRNGTNPGGSKKVWVPKSTPDVFDVGVNSHKM